MHFSYSLKYNTNLAEDSPDMTGILFRAEPMICDLPVACPNPVRMTESPSH